MAYILFVILVFMFVLILVPRGEYDVTPASAAVDRAKREFSSRIIATDVLNIVNRSFKDILKKGMIIGLGMALIAFLVFVNFIGAFALLPSLAALGGGILLTEKLTQKLYQQWQEELFKGIPTLINFIPSFLEIESVTAREAVAYTLPFLPEPLKSEIWRVNDKIKRTGKAQEALEEFADKVNHSLVDAVAYRLSAAWDIKITPDLFEDISDQVDYINELAVSKATSKKTGYMALVCVIGLIGMVMIFGYPGIKYMFQNMAGGFGM